MAPPSPPPAQRARCCWIGAVALLTVLVSSVTAVATTAPADAQPAPSWSTHAVRFEPVGDSVLEIGGLGAYRGAVEVRRGAGGLAVINDVTLEDYVAGIAEVPTTWPAAALEAQAIAARTYALRSMRGTIATSFRAVGADICATESCQVYRGVAGERRETSTGWVTAAAATAGRVLLYDGVPILAKYSSSNGGFSDAGGAPYLPAVDDPDDLAVSPWARWRSIVPLEHAAAALPGPGQLVEVNRAGDVVVARRLQPDGTIVDHGYTPHELRRAFNARVPTPANVPVPVPSTRFVAWTEETQVVLEGGGYGHLTGMSQYGAMGKARRGLSADDILAAYYGGLRPTALPPEQLPPTIRVALDLDAPAVTVAATGRFRVIAGDGGPIAHLTGGAWTVSADPAGVRVAAPADQSGSPGLVLAAVDQAAVRIDLALPSQVVLRDADTGTAADLGLLDAGSHHVPLTGAVPDGTTLDLVAEADAGGGRLAHATLTIGTEPPAVVRGADAGRARRADVAGPAPAGRPASRTAATTVALLLVVGTGTAAALTRRRQLLAEPVDQRRGSS